MTGTSMTIARRMMNNFKGYSSVGGMTAPGNGESEGHLRATRRGEWLCFLQ
jgi:hypothetical protein